MDGDAGIEVEVDRFNRILPLPYRVAILLVAGKLYDFRAFETNSELGRRLGLGREPSLPRPRPNCRVYYPLT
jgi:hypothetical protein